MLVRLDTLTPWLGEPIDDVSHPRNIEQLWSSQELADVGLAIPVGFTTPEGKVRSGSARFELIEGIVHEVYDVVDAPPPPVPESITRRQFFQQLAVHSIITEEEAENAMAGTIPVALLEIVDLLLEQARFDARMYLKGASAIERSHEMTDTVAWLYGWGEQQTDAFFHAAAALL